MQTLKNIVLTHKINKMIFFLFGATEFQKIDRSLFDLVGYQRHELASRATLTTFAVFTHPTHPTICCPAFKEPDLCQGSTVTFTRYNPSKPINAPKESFFNLGIVGRAEPFTPVSAGPSLQGTPEKKRPGDDDGNDYDVQIYILPYSQFFMQTLLGKIDWEARYPYQLSAPITKEVILADGTSTDKTTITLQSGVYSFYQFNNQTGGILAPTDVEPTLYEWLEVLWTTQKLPRDVRVYKAFGPEYFINGIMVFDGSMPSNLKLTNLDSPVIHPLWTSLTSQYPKGPMNRALSF